MEQMASTYIFETLSTHEDHHTSSPGMGFNGLALLASWILPEERLLPTHEQLFRLQPAHKWNLVLWKAVNLMAQFCRENNNFKLCKPENICVEVADLVHPENGQALSLDNETAKMQPRIDDGDLVRIEVADVRV